MAVWMYSGMGAATKGYDAMSSAQQAGTAIGAGLGGMILLVIWGIGSTILGIFTLLTRPKR